MFRLRVAHDDLIPIYMTEFSSGADLKSAMDLVIPSMKVAKVPTGVWIEEFDQEKLFKDGLGSFRGQIIPELQVRARSGLAAKHSVTLANGVGTIDADYRDEICVLLINFGIEPFAVKEGDRIAQLVLSLAFRLPDLGIQGARQGGFGSTGV